MSTTNKKFATYLDEDESAVLERIAVEDERTIAAILRIGFRMYLGSRNNWRVDQDMNVTRQLPNG